MKCVRKIAKVATTATRTVRKFSDAISELQFQFKLRRAQDNKQGPSPRLRSQLHTNGWLVLKHDAKGQRRAGLTLRLKAIYEKLFAAMTIVRC